MENQNNTTLRQAYNRVNITGYLKKMDLKEVIDKNNNPAIGGSLVIHVPPASDYEVTAFVGKFVSDGKGGLTENRFYPGFQTVKNEYVPIATLMENGKDFSEALAACTRVSVSGELTRNEYNGQSGFTSRDSIRGSFFNRLDDPIEPKATFEVECFIDKITDEVRNEEETGRKIVDVWVPMYKGAVLPQRLIVGNELASEFEDIYERGQTARLNGDIINTISTVTTAAAGFGRKMETSTRIHELVIMGGLLPYDESDSRSYSTELISAAINERNNVTIPSIMAKERKTNSAPAAPVAKTAAFTAATKDFKF